MDAEPEARRVSAATAAWFGQAFGEPTAVQREGWRAIAGGAHALLIAPTGSGKTLAAFLWAIDRCLALADDAPSGVRVLYISPLKALVYDIERNLREPLRGIERHAEALGQPYRASRIDVRTGDTTAAARRAQARKPGDILVTTPESLFLILGSKARETLRSVHTVIVDEIHALAPTKRGTHLALSLERLETLTTRPPQRIGLSATVHPAKAIAQFLAGRRPVEIVDHSAQPDVALQVVVPDSPPATAGETTTGPRPGTEGSWPGIHRALLDIIAANRTTIVFVNSRGLCERLAQDLNAAWAETLDRAEHHSADPQDPRHPPAVGEELVLAHHGSVSHEKRAEMEQALKAGQVRAIVATSSLELGIDMGTVDEVVLIESPGSVARGLQRIGRAGHQVGHTSRGTIFPKYRGDLLECALIADRMARGEIEHTVPAGAALDVLAQQLVAICCDAPQPVDALLAIARRAHSFAELSREVLISVLDMLCGRYPSDEFADLTPRLSWDRTLDVVQARRGSALISRLNAGTIPDRGLYTVHLGEEGPRVGELDEEMVFETRVGDRIILGASTWAVQSIGRDRVIVAMAPGEPGRLPFWHGDRPGRSAELGRALGAFTRTLARRLDEDRGTGESAAVASSDLLNPNAARQLTDYVREQRAATGTLPSDRAITVERFRDELGDWRVCILSPFGNPVHAPWAMAIAARLGGHGARRASQVQLMPTNDGIIIRFADTEQLPAIATLFPSPDEVESLITAELGQSALFSGLFRENAARSLLIPRRSAGRRNPLWAQRRKAQALLGAVSRYPQFAVVLETYRQALADVFDLDALRRLLTDVQLGAIQVEEVETASPSPFARSLVLAYMAGHIYDQDAPVAERKAQALTLDRSLLAELLGQGELRSLLDANELQTLEGELALADPARAPRDADELHDRLRRLGDLSAAEIAARAPSSSWATWLADLAAAGRATEVTVAGETRHIAAEDAPVYRDGLGCVLATTLPDALLEPVPDPLARLISRYARTHGPFRSAQPAHRFGLDEAIVERTLSALATEGRVVHGEMRPGGSGEEWCDAEVLRSLKRRTLARLRREVAPVEPCALARFLPTWHGIDAVDPSAHRLMDVIAQLEGLPIAWSVYIGQVLPRRVRDFDEGDLDRLCAGGDVVWVGHGAVGRRDGRIALYHRDNLALLLDDPEPYLPPRGHTGEVQGAILYHLRRAGACFAFELEPMVRDQVNDARAEDIDAALWALVWAGQVTNDTIGPLSTLGRAAPRRRANPSYSPYRRSRSSQRGRTRSAGDIGSGRWSLVDTVLSPTRRASVEWAADPSVDSTPGTDASRHDTTLGDSSDTERVIERARVLLARHGIVSRECIAAEGIGGGFGPFRQALAAMEHTGEVRRGYFVEGLSAVQFAAGPTVDALRAASAPPGRGLTQNAAPGTIILAALDPANPYGTLLPWPETRQAGQGDAGAGRPRRVPGAWVVLDEGEPLLYAGPNGRHLLTFAIDAGKASPAIEAALPRLAEVATGARRRSHRVETIDSVPARESQWRPVFERAGYRAAARGLERERVLR